MKRLVLSTEYSEAENEMQITHDVKAHSYLLQGKVTMECRQTKGNWLRTKMDLRRKIILPIAVLLGVFLLIQDARAVLIGNDVSVGRSQASDGATQIFQVYFNAPVPGDGTIDSFSIFDQSNGLTGHAYVLRPQGGGNYLVLSDNIFTSTGTQATKTFAVTPIDVEAGDLIAHYQIGVPYTDGALGGSFVEIFYPSVQPVLSSIITLPSGSYTQPSGFIRDYAFAANFEPTPVAPEPSSWCLLGLGLIGLRHVRRRRGRVCEC